MYVCVDNGKVTGWCKIACWRAASEFSKVMAKLGLQDAARKRTEPSIMPRPWAGSVVHTNASEVALLVSKKKWEKTRRMVNKLHEMAAVPEVDQKVLECIRGYLVSHPYRWMVPI